MRFYLVSLAGLVLFGVHCFVAVGEEPPPAVIRPGKNVIKLFDGRSLDGFYMYLSDTKYEDPRGVFRVTDGMLHITGDGLGCLTTEQKYADYHLVLEFKWGPRTWGDRKANAKDSGLLIHSVGPDGAYNGIWMHSVEVQIIEGGIGDFILVRGTNDETLSLPISLTCEVGRDQNGEVVWKRGAPRETFSRQNLKRVNWYGRDPDWQDKLGFRGTNDLDSPDGQWNRLDVICNHGHIQTYLNGTLVNEAYEVDPETGRIQLQAEFAEIFFRRFELWPLGLGPEPTKP